MEARLEALQALLGGALKIVADLERHPLFVRLLDLFQRMPGEDRKPILTVLEREVAFRLLQSPQDAMAGMYVTRPNPKARLYTRVVEGEASAPYVSREKLMQGVMRAARAAYRTLATAGDDAEFWQPAILDALVLLGSEERAALAWVNREMLALIDRAERMADVAREPEDATDTARRGSHA